MESSIKAKHIEDKALLIKFLQGFRKSVEIGSVGLKHDYRPSDYEDKWRCVTIGMLDDTIALLK